MFLSCGLDIIFVKLMQLLRELLRDAYLDRLFDIRNFALVRIECCHTRTERNKDGVLDDQELVLARHLKHLKHHPNNSTGIC